MGTTSTKPSATSLAELQDETPEQLSDRYARSPARADELAAHWLSDCCALSGDYFPHPMLMMLAMQDVASSLETRPSPLALAVLVRARNFLGLAPLNPLVVREKERLTRLALRVPHTPPLPRPWEGLGVSKSEGNAVRRMRTLLREQVPDHGSRPEVMALLGALPLATVLRYALSLRAEDGRSHPWVLNGSEPKARFPQRAVYWGLLTGVMVGASEVLNAESLAPRGAGAGAPAVAWA